MLPRPTNLLCLPVASEPLSYCCPVSSLQPWRTVGGWRRQGSQTGAGRESKVYCGSLLNVKTKACLCSQTSLKTQFCSPRSPLLLPPVLFQGPPRISTQQTEPQWRCHSPAAQAGNKQIILHPNPDSAQIISLYGKQGLMEISNKLFRRMGMMLKTTFFCFAS